MLEDLLTNIFYDYTSIYLFSALLQANAAILAIVGVFGIFKIQSIQTQIDFLKNWLTFPDGRRIMNGWSPKDVFNFENRSNVEQNEQISGTKTEIIKSMLESWMVYKKKIQDIKPIIINSSLILGIGIIVDSVGIICSKLIHDFPPALELVILVLVLLFHIYLILKTVERIKRIIS